MEERPSWKEGMKGEIVLHNPDNPEETVKAIIQDEPTKEFLKKSAEFLGLEEPTKPKVNFFKSHTVRSERAKRPFQIRKPDIRIGNQVILKNHHIGIVKSIGKDGVSVEQLYGQDKGKCFGVLWKDVRIPINEKLEK